MNYTTSIPDNSFSLCRALRAIADGHALSGREREVSDAASKSYGLRASGNGFILPLSTRDLNATGNASLGGYTVETSVLGKEFIHLLQEQSFIFTNGAKRLSGLRGDVSLPGAASGATAYWVAENAAVTPSTPAFLQVGLTPHRLSAQTVVSKRLLAQASLDAESLVREHLASVIGQAVDLAALTGTGNDGQPTGVLHTSGVSSVTFGAAATMAKLQEFELRLGEANALSGQLAYAVSPATRAKLKQAPVLGSTVPTFIWSPREGSKLAGLTGSIDGYSATATQHLAASDKVTFGNWSDLVVADWGGVEILSDPFTKAGQHQIVLTINMLVDVCIRHPQSFCVSSDSGAQ